MKTRTTIELLVVAGILWLMIWFMGERQARTAAEGGRLLPRVSVESTLRLTLERGDMEIECEKTPDGWFIVRPLKSRANEAEIDRILAELEDLRKLEVITESERERRELSLNDYRLGKQPQARLAFADDRCQESLLVGRESPLDGRVYVRFGADTDVIATSANILSVFPVSVDDLRDKLVVRGNAARIARLEIEKAGGGFTEMTRRMGRWVMLQPVKNARLNAKKIEGLLDVLCEIRARAFLSEREAVRCGLTENTAALKIGFWEEGGGGGRTLLLGKRDAVDTNSVFARLADGDLVYVVDPGIGAAFAVDSAELREHRVFCMSDEEIAAIRLRDGEDKVEFRRHEDKEWRIVEPRKGKADAATMNSLVSAIVSLKASDFVEGSETNLVRLGLVDSRRSIEVGRLVGKLGSAETSAVDNVVWDRLALGNTDKQTGAVGAKLEDDSSAMLIGPDCGLGPVLDGDLPGTGYEIAAQTGNDSNAEEKRRWVSPMLYSDRHVLAVALAEVKSITLAKNGIEQTVRRDDKGVWNTPVGTGSGSVSTQAVDAILAAMSNLCAQRVEWQQNAGLASYGLDAPTAEVTLGLSGESGIRKTLAVGFLAGIDGVYATIRGQDMVFVLSRDLAGLLVRDLISGAHDDHN